MYLYLPLGYLLPPIVKYLRYFPEKGKFPVTYFVNASEIYLKFLKNSQQSRLLFCWFLVLLLLLGNGKILRHRYFIFTYFFGNEEWFCDVRSWIEFLLKTKSQWLNLFFKKKTTDNLNFKKCYFVPRIKLYLV